MTAVLVTDKKPLTADQLALLRQDFMKAALQGLCASYRIRALTPEQVVALALLHADLAIEALNK